MSLLFTTSTSHKLTAGNGHHFVAWTIKETLRTSLTVCQAWLSNIVAGNIPQPCDFTKLWIIYAEKLENNTPCIAKSTEFALLVAVTNFINKNHMIHSDLNNLEQPKHITKR